jgi:hypothetical protein
MLSKGHCNCSALILPYEIFCATKSDFFVLKVDLPVRVSFSEQAPGFVLFKQIQNKTEKASFKNKGT